MPKKRGRRNHRDTYAYLSRITYPLRIPLKCYFEITQWCNLYCVHCYMNRTNKRKDMTYEEICSALDQLADIGTLDLHISGGEPLVRKDFYFGLLH